MLGLLQLAFGTFYCLRLAGITLVVRNVEVGFGASLDITFQW